MPQKDNLACAKVLPGYCPRTQGNVYSFGSPLLGSRFLCRVFFSIRVYLQAFNQLLLLTDVRLHLFSLISSFVEEGQDQFIGIAPVRKDGLVLLKGMVTHGMVAFAPVLGAVIMDADDNPENDNSRNK